MTPTAWSGTAATDGVGLLRRRHVQRRIAHDAQLACKRGDLPYFPRNELSLHSSNSFCSLFSV